MGKIDDFSQVIEGQLLDLRRAKVLRSRRITCFIFRYCIYNQSNPFKGKECKHKLVTIKWNSC